MVGDDALARLMAGTYLMTFFAGMVDAIAFLGIAKALPTHVTGTTAKSAVFLASGTRSTSFVTEKGLPGIAMIFCFFVGALASGYASNSPERKNLRTCGAVIVCVGFLVIVASIIHLAEIPEGKYVLAFALGMQNAIITTFTGFARTTHMTGTVTDIGLLLGQATNPANRSNAILWKVRALCIMGIAFITGALIATWLFVDANLGEWSLVLPGLGQIFVGVMGIVHTVRAERRAKEAERRAKEEEDAQARKARLSNIFKKSVRKVSVGAALARPDTAALDRMRELGGAGGITEDVDKISAPEASANLVLSVSKAVRKFKSSKSPYEVPGPYTTLVAPKPVEMATAATQTDTFSDPDADCSILGDTPLSFPPKALKWESFNVE